VAVLVVCHRMAVVSRQVAAADLAVVVVGLEMACQVAGLAAW
jgi:hypothetical protein